MACDDDFESRQDYLLDRISGLVVCSALGLVGISLYSSSKLNLMLHPKFHLWVLTSAFALLLMVAMRTVAPWTDVTKGKSGNCASDGHARCWTPWRHIVVLYPVALYLVNLPNEAFSSSYVQLRPGDLGFCKVAETGVIGELTWHELGRAVRFIEARELLEGKRVVVIGKYNGGSAKQFTLSRFTIRCCAADAVPWYAVVLIDPANVDRIDPRAMHNKWIKVTGLLTFTPYRSNDFLATITVLPKEGESIHNYVEIVPMPTNPFLN